jgi:acetyl esterase
MPEIIPVLEPAAQEFTDSTAKPPFLYEMAPEKGRIIVDSVQDGEVPQPPVDVTSLTIPGGPGPRCRSAFTGRRAWPGTCR